jgi:hypothetical protein
MSLSFTDHLERLGILAIGLSGARRAIQGKKFLESSEAALERRAAGPRWPGQLFPAPFKLEYRGVIRETGNMADTLPLTAMGRLCPPG